MLSTVEADCYLPWSGRFSAGARAVSAAWLRPLERVRAWQKLRRGHKELARLSERELRDIGLRSTICHQICGA